MIWKFGCHLFSPVGSFIIIWPQLCLFLFIFISSGVVSFCLSYGLLMRSLYIIIPNYNIELTAFLPPKWSLPKLALTSDRAKRIPAPCGKCLLQFNRCLVSWVLWVQIISMLVVIVNSLWVLEGYPIPTNSTEFVFTHPPIFTICGHQYHGIVFLFHIKDMKRHIDNTTTKSIHVPNIPVS